MALWSCSMYAIVRAVRHNSRHRYRDVALSPPFPSSSWPVLTTKMVCEPEHLRRANMKVLTLDNIARLVSTCYRHHNGHEIYDLCQWPRLFALEAFLSGP